jgi:succinate dehydrogenase cytochrome b subunit
MKRALYLYQSSVGKKVAMALSGLFVVGWLVGHMTGNLKIFLGRDESGVYAIDHYAEFLHEMGSPLFPEGVFLWIVRGLLLAAILIHIVSAAQLTRQSRAARVHHYGKQESLSFSYASRTMRWGGVILLLYIVYHLLHLTLGSVHPDFVEGEVYNNLIVGFQNPLVVGFYLVANLALGMHLYHGLWSLTQTLGLSHPRYNHLRRPFAAGLTGILIGGFISVPLAVLFGILS